MRTVKLTYSQTGTLCRSLAVLLHSGIPMADCVYLLAREEKGHLRPLLEELGRRLDEGGLLWDAMEASGAFPAFAVGLIRVGEHTGRTEEALTNLADYYEEHHRTQRHLKNSLTYPALLLLLMAVVIGVLLVKVLPVFDSVYASLGTRLTGISAGLLYAGQALRKAMPAVLGVLILAAAGAVTVSAVPAVRQWAVTAGSRMFGDRGIFRKFNNARFARAMAMGLASGLPEEEALALAEHLLAGAPGAGQRCRQCKEQLEAGASLAEALAAAQLLPPAAGRILGAGIRGGNGDAVMAGIADRLMEDARESLDALIGRVEPAMVLVSSLLVGVILLATMLPLMNILSALG